MTPRTRRRLFDGLRIAVCGAALWLVIRGVSLDDHVSLKAEADQSVGDGELVGVVISDADPLIFRLTTGHEQRVPHADIAVDDHGQLQISYGLKTALRNSSKALLLLAVLLHFPVTFLQGIRLQWLLGVQGIRIRYWECIKLSFAGNFLNFATPLGSNAGDVFKAYFVTAHTQHKTEAVTTIALDRALGLGTLITCVMLITTFSGSNSRLAEFRPYALTFFCIGVAGVFAYLSPTFRKHLIPKRWLSRLPMFAHLQRIDKTACTLAGHKPVLAVSVLTTVVLQVLAVGAYFTVAAALTLDAHFGNIVEYYAYFYTGAVIQALPGPPQGLGTVELAYLFFFAPFGTPSQIVCVAFLVRVVVLVCALPGLLVTITGSYKPRQNAMVEDTASPSQATPTEPRPLARADNRADVS